MLKEFKEFAMRGNVLDMAVGIREVNRLHEPAPAPAAPSTKECPHCVSTIPVKATRCPNCTSQL